MGFRATINLLNTPILVAISGAFRLYITVLFFGTEHRVLTHIAGGLVIYTVYTLDRTLECKEDSVNRSELTGSRKDIAFLVSLSAFIIGKQII